MTTPLEDRSRKIELILSDVDGVLTDGAISFDNAGIELKSFNVRDGLGIKLWQRAGYKFGVLTARTSHIVKLRAAELKIEIVRQGLEEKLPAVKELLRELKLTPSQVCYVGDDLPDLPLLRFAGVGVAVADAVPELREAALYVTQLPGGRGAVREIIEVLLKAKNRWEDLVRSYWR
jgi:3-deoxy-D-manno-octulosonate 8-phosphate phosphatase (KDO 8-P phosphatase)